MAHEDSGSEEASGGPSGRLTPERVKAGLAAARRQRLIDRDLLAELVTVSRSAAAAADVEELRTWLHNHNAELESAHARLESAERRLSEAETALRAQHDALEELREWNHGLAAQIADLTTRLAPVEQFSAASRAVPDPEAIGLEQFDAGPAGAVLGYQSGALAVERRDDYIAFEDVFRLSEDIIRERQRPYLELLGDRRPVLDVGCGRGEFLELLRDAGIPAVGVDLDPGMVARARGKGLEVEEGDGVRFLERRPDGSLGAVFAAQVVEHLPYEQLITFLRLSARKLAPGGLLIAETVNPHSPGALKNFWFDLTHQHPVFPEVLLTLCRSIGFASAYVFHPGGSGDIARDRERMGDYALVAERAGAG